MKTKIILGLGLCLMLTVINLQRAMDNYGITDAKFKVGVLADESSSGTTYGGYHIQDVDIVITLTSVSWDPDWVHRSIYTGRTIQQLTLYGLYIQPWGNTFRIDGGKRICTEGGLYDCVDRDLGNATYWDLMGWDGYEHVSPVSTSFSVVYQNYFDY